VKGDHPSTNEQRLEICEETFIHAESSIYWPQPNRRRPHWVVDYELPKNVKSLSFFFRL